MSAARPVLLSAVVCVFTAGWFLSVRAEESRTAGVPVNATQENIMDRSVRIRMSDLKKKSPALYEQLMRQINADREKQLERLRVEDPEKYRIEMKARTARLRKQREEKLKEEAGRSPGK